MLAGLGPFSSSAAALATSVCSSSTALATSACSLMARIVATSTCLGSSWQPESLWEVLGELWQRIGRKFVGFVGKVDMAGGEEEGERGECFGGVKRVNTSVMSFHCACLLSTWGEKKRGGLETGREAMNHHQWKAGIGFRWLIEQSDSVLRSLDDLTSKIKFSAKKTVVVSGDVEQEVDLVPRSTKSASVLKSLNHQWAASASTAVVAALYYVHYSRYLYL